MSIRIQETDDGWVIEVTGKKTASAHPTHRMDDLIRTEGWVTHDDLSRAVQAERARCVAWAAAKRLAQGVLWGVA